MDLTAYKNQLLNLVPLGLAWPRQPNLRRDDLLEAKAAELARVDSRVADMLREADPRTALETLPDWERVAGLPDGCTVTSSITIQERRTRLVQKLTSTGGQSPQYFKDIAEELGYETEIIEHSPFTCGYSECGLISETLPSSTRVSGLTDTPGLRHYWNMNVLEPRVTWFRVGESELGKDPFAKIDFATDLECVINKLQPAHGVLVFAYEGA